MKSIYDLSGKVALVTGTASKRGIGRAIALRLARDGADVAITDIHRTPQDSPEDDKIEGWKGLDSLIEEIEAFGSKAMTVLADVTQSQQVQRMVDKTLEKFGKIDILVNNAGILGPFKVPTLEADEEVWRQVLAVNLIGPFLCARAVAKSMVERGEGGKIVNTASIAGKIGTRMFAAYSASKAGLINLTQTLALELGPHRINVNAICPGSTATELGSGRHIRSEARRQGISIEEATGVIRSDVIPSIPLGRIAQPEDQADAVAFLASKESDHITGVALNVNGGRLMAP